MIPYLLAVAGGYLIGNSMNETSQLMAKGGMTPKEQMLKELQKLQRDLNSSRLRTYNEGDTSQEEMTRQREREVKLKRFNEILEKLETEKMADGGMMAKGGVNDSEHDKKIMAQLRKKEYGYVA